jgi:YVTN family beta-propeller protein
LLVPRFAVFPSNTPLAKQLRKVPALLAAGIALASFLCLATAGAQPAIGPKAYIGLFGDNSVAVFDTGSNVVLSSIPVPAGPHGIVITPDDKRVYVSSDGASTVSVIDTTTDSITSTVEVGQTPHGLAITPDGSRVLVAGFGTDMVSAIDTATNKIAWRLPVPNPHNLAISPDGKTVYVASQMPASPSLAILDLPGQRQVGSVSLPNVPRALNFSPDGSQLWFTEAGVDEVQVLDPTNNEISATIPVGASPHHPLFTPDGQLGLVVSQGPGELWLLDPATDTSIDTIKVGDMPHWIAVAADGQTAYVTNELSNDLSIVDLTSATVTDTISVGNAPRKIVVQTGAPAVSTTTATISQFAFNPASLTVASGQSVTWTNSDPVQHTTTSDTPGWNSGPLSAGDAFTMTFATPGTYAYHCSIHPFMHGTVIVTG